MLRDPLSAPDSLKLIASSARRSANPPLRPPPPPKKMEIEGRERSRSPNDTEEKDTGDDDEGDKLADDV